jgi:hypothetical protein
MRPATQAELDSLNWSIVHMRSAEELAERTKMVFWSPCGQIICRNQRGLLASLERAMDSGVRLPPIQIGGDPKKWELFDGNHRLYLARLRRESGLHAVRVSKIHVPVNASNRVWVDLQELAHIDPDSSMGSVPQHPDWEWRDDPRRAAIGLQVVARPAPNAL